jgi:hypothetical protein
MQRPRWAAPVLWPRTFQTFQFPRTSDPERKVETGERALLPGELPSQRARPGRGGALWGSEGADPTHRRAPRDSRAPSACLPCPPPQRPPRFPERHAHPRLTAEPRRATAPAALRAGFASQEARERWEEEIGAGRRGRRKREGGDRRGEERGGGRRRGKEGVTCASGRRSEAQDRASPALGAERRSGAGTSCNKSQVLGTPRNLPELRNLALCQPHTKQPSSPAAMPGKCKSRHPG